MAEDMPIAFFDAFHESKQEVVESCHSQQHNLIGSMTVIVRQTFGPNAPAGTFDSLCKMIVSEIDANIGRLVCDLALKRGETILQDRRIRKAYAAGLGKQWDVFICHAREDKRISSMSLRSDCTIRGLRFGTTRFHLNCGTVCVGRSMRVWQIHATGSSY